MIRKEVDQDVRVRHRSPPGLPQGRGLPAEPTALRPREGALQREGVPSAGRSSRVRLQVGFDRVLHQERKSLEPSPGGDLKQGRPVFVLHLDRGAHEAIVMHVHALRQRHRKPVNRPRCPRVL